MWLRGSRAVHEAPLPRRGGLRATEPTLPPDPLMGHREFSPKAMRLSLNTNVAPTGRIRRVHVCYDTA